MLPSAFCRTLAYIFTDSNALSLRAFSALLPRRGKILSHENSWDCSEHPSLPHGRENRNTDFKRYSVLETWPKTPSGWKPAQLISKQWRQYCRFWTVCFIEMRKQGLEQLELERNRYSAQGWFCSWWVYLLVWQSVDPSVASHLPSSTSLWVLQCLFLAFVLRCTLQAWLLSAQEISLDPGMKARSWTGGVVWLETALHRAVFFFNRQ